MVDIDITSQYHPLADGPDVILEALEGIGLCEPVIIRSSRSGGLHLYFPLSESESSWQVALLMHQALKLSGISIKCGQCETFPNKKSRNSDYNGHRLPLQQGSCILDDDFNPISNSPELFVKHWAIAASRNLLHHLDAAIETQAYKPVDRKLPPLPCFTGPGESNEVLKELANYGDRYHSKRTIPSLANWMKETIVTLPGYQEFCSAESRADIAKDWCERWAKSHLKQRRSYLEKEAGPDHNAVAAQEAEKRLRTCLKELGPTTYASIRALWASLREIGLNIFGIGIGWKTFKKLAHLWKHLIGNNPAYTVNNSKGMCTQTEQEIQPVHTSQVPPSKPIKNLGAQVRNFVTPIVDILKSDSSKDFTPPPPGWKRKFLNRA